jgi:hypothetical protein
MAERRPIITPVERHPQALQFIERDGCLFGERPYQAGLTQPVTTLERVVVELLRGIAWKALGKACIEPEDEGRSSPCPGHETDGSAPARGHGASLIAGYAAAQNQHVARHDIKSLIVPQRCGIDSIHQVTFMADSRKYNFFTTLSYLTSIVNAGERN